MMLVFYSTPETCSLATHIVLEEIGVDYELRQIDFASKQQQSPEFLAVNPKARVPALVTDRGILTETPAMLAFLAQSYPDAGLAPLDDTFAFAEIQSFNSYLCSTVHVAHAHRMRWHRWTDDEAAAESMKRKVPDSVGACFDHIEKNELKGPYVTGETFTIADPYLFTLARWMENDGVDPAKYPKVKAHRDRMHERPSVKKALAAST